ncbi:MAG: LytTR family DNA-binding domain-containing protein [Flavobacteriales bacterium]|nr:LytTR family DNA-binding domain-containing protein [Flavobacteriales bacterium]
MSKLKVIAVDDERSAREAMQQSLEQLAEKVDVLGVVSSVAEAYDLIVSEKPDLVFLDIEMPRESGFDLLRKFDTIEFDIVFTTAFDSYAIQAIKFSALDYLLKPIGLDELSKAIDRSMESGFKARMEYYKNLLQNLEEKENDPTIVLREKDRSTLVKVSEIVRLESDRNYTQVHLTSGDKILLSKTLKVFDNMLTDQGFMRIHKSHLINTRQLDFVDSKQPCVHLKNGEQVPYSSRKKRELNDYLKGIKL